MCRERGGQAREEAGGGEVPVGEEEKDKGEDGGRGFWGEGREAAILPGCLMRREFWARAMLLLMMLACVGCGLVFTCGFVKQIATHIMQQLLPCVRYASTLTCLAAYLEDNMLQVIANSAGHMLP